ncbi:1859_t:CDS:2 [Entrophospora sp. SA101]|nr:5616_t:CDS:2 [Entrophospora sp. SA101]CAJ0651005.1 2644_t:CDS:2 [Entrophospora sp. SA101]CAJ0651013.1 2650_t:CDS:2 [Entrophospora sp. SA101]CAJ0752307.1 1859_t:CDS:2 [Entrophospora sp. SA101]CAJ0836426.1 10073_t:CDS:2 [Entrophospora sp. SA101]
MSFRNVDVDALDEEQLLQEELFTFSDGNEIDSQTALKNVQSKGTDVRNLSLRGDTLGALIAAIENPPYGLHTTEAKDKNTTIVMEVLISTKASDVPSLVESLNAEQQDVLMKYIYRGMSSPKSYNSAVLLNWHEKLTEVAGLGSIVRVFTDRKTV